MPSSAAPLTAVAVTVLLIVLCRPLALRAHASRPRPERGMFGIFSGLFALYVRTAEAGWRRARLHAATA